MNEMLLDDTRVTAANPRSDAPVTIGATTLGPLPATMSAIVQNRYGDADVLQLCTVNVPQPGPGQVLIEVAAAGVDRGVWHLMTGLPWLIRIFGFGFRGPKQRVPGLDVAGRIVAVGAAGTGFAIGDEVFGIGTGTFARYALADAGKLARRPANVPAEQAAAVPISGITALQAVCEIGAVRAGQRVLVLGASGGVGSYAVQLAAGAGAHVTGVASVEKLEFVLSLGAERVIDYRTGAALHKLDHYDLIVDIGGLSPLGALRRALTRTGMLVIVGGEGGDRLTGGIGRQLRAMLLSRFVSQHLTMFIAAEDGGRIGQLADLLASGKLKAPVERVYPLAATATALADLANGAVRGKVVVAPGSDQSASPFGSAHD